MNACSDAPLRIGIDVRELITREITGIGRYLRNLLQSSAIRSSRHTFVYYGNAETDFSELPDKGVRNRLQARSTVTWDQLALPRAAARDRLDVLYSPYDKGPVYAPCPVVLTFHDLLFLDIPDLRRGKAVIYNAAYVLQRRLMVRRAARVLTVSRNSRNDLIRRFRVPIGKLGVTYNGVQARFRPDLPAQRVEELLGRMALEEGYILYVGNYKPHKNVGALIEAYSHLPEPLRMRHHLVLAGAQGSFEGTTRSQIQALGLGDVTHTVGIVPERDLPALYRGAALFVFPSLKEGFGLPPLEAMSSGIPVVASNVDSLPEVIGEAGTLVDVRNNPELVSAMNRLLTDPSARTDHIRKGLCRARRFSNDAIGSGIVRQIEQAAYGGRPL